MANTDKKLNEIKDRAKALPKGSQVEKDMNWLITNLEKLENEHNELVNMMN